MDYRASHQKPTKGRTYAETFNTLPYRRIVWAWEKEVLEGFVQGLPRESFPLRYLDFACGTGRILGHLVEYMGESYGVDVSESMINVAKENVHQAKLLLCDLTKEEVFPLNYFDIITAFRFFLNAQDELRESALYALSKIIKKNGYLIFNIHMNKGCLVEIGLRIQQRIKRNTNSAYNTLSISETKLMLEKFDFEVVKVFHYGIIPVFREGSSAFINQIDQIERKFSRSKRFLPYSRYVIYVCKLKECAG